MLSSLRATDARTFLIEGWWLHFVASTKSVASNVAACSGVLRGVLGKLNEAFESSTLPLLTCRIVNYDSLITSPPHQAIYGAYNSENYENSGRNPYYVLDFIVFFCLHRLKRASTICWRRSRERNCKRWINSFSISSAMKKNDPKVQVNGDFSFVTFQWELMVLFCIIRLKL